MELFIFGWAFSGLIGYLLGKGKGKGTSGFWLGMLLGPIGWIITAVGKGDTKICPQCKSAIHKDATICPNCRSIQGGAAVASAGSTILCPECKKPMPADAPGCTNCGRANWSKA